MFRRRFILVAGSFSSLLCLSTVSFSAEPEQVCEPKANSGQACVPKISIEKSVEQRQEIKTKIEVQAAPIPPPPPAKAAAPKAPVKAKARPVIVAVKPEPAKHEVFNFRVAPMMVLQGGEKTYTVMGSWNPEWHLTPSVSLGFNLGATALKNALDKKFLVLEYQLVLGYLLPSHFGFEIAGGAQTWTKNGGTYADLGATLSYRFTPGRLLDRVFLGYSALLIPNHFASQVKVGLGFSL